MDARQRDVLIALIREYVDSAEPVGSRVLSKRHFPHLSPATIRNVMADLEELGYLAQPHTSAGRIPTDKAYRFYVDSFPPPSPGGKPGGAALPTRRSGIDGFMERTSSHLSTATRLTGLRLAPPLAQTVIARVDLMPLEEDRALAVVATDAGWITVREIALDPPLASEEARAIGRELTRRFRDRSVEEIVDMENAPADPLDALHTRARGVTEQIVAMLRGRTLYVSGAINILDDGAASGEPETRIQELERELAEQKDRMLRAMAEADNVRRRAQRDAEDRVRYANESLLRELIPVLDNLDRALASARAAKGAEGVVAGVELIQRELLRVLERAGVSRYSAVGQPFDPTRHEAIARVVSGDAAPDTVVSETAPGYVLQGRVLRPALVAVAAAPDEDAA